MPFAPFKSVREVSSEDPIHCAANLLKHDSGRKWKTKHGGEKVAHVILEMCTPCEIIGIDIGNEHSAFVEVLVGRTGCTSDDFQDILITSSFMTPMESRNSEQINRVRCFGKDALVSTVLSNKWQFVKIVCTQPFNRHVQYGLSFIKIRVAEFTDGNVNPRANLMSSVNKNELGDNFKKLIASQKFTLRQESPDSESETTTALFNRWKKTQQTDNLPTAAAAIRQASSLTGFKGTESETQKGRSRASIYKNADHSEEKEVLDRIRTELLFIENDDSKQNKKQEKLIKHIEEDKKRLCLENSKQQNRNESPAIKKAVKHVKQSLSKGADENQQKKKQLVDEKPKKHIEHGKGHKRRSDGLVEDRNSSTSKRAKLNSEIQYRPFSELLRGVVFVISGITNPDRTNLRSKALAMGAKYKADWDNGCSHLICAFKNTPKYNQVLGKGKIVTRKWIEQCFAEKKYLPWRRFTLDNNDASQPESDDEIFDESLKPKQSCSSHVVPDRHSTDNIAGLYDKEDDRRDDKSDGESDTEDELDRLKHETNNKENSVDRLNSAKRNDAFEALTEEEDYLKEKFRSKFFKSQKLYISDTIGIVERLKLESYIGQYGGTVTTELHEADYAISEKHMKKFKGETVNPKWIYDCVSAEKKIPTTSYKLQI